jgi:parvulin-like peptidyl-prolyl isomerase
MKQSRLFVFVLAGAAFLPGMACADLTSFISTLKNCLKNPSACFSSSSAPSGLVLAHVGDAVITDAEFNARISQIPVQYRNTYAAPQARRQLLDNMINQKLLYQAVRQLGLDREEAFKMRMATYEESLMAQTVRIRFCAVTDAEIASYYKVHPDEYGPSLQVQVSQIQVKTLSEAKKAQALLAAGKPFAVVSKAVSGNPNPITNRLVFPLYAGHKVSMYEEALSRLHVGQNSPSLKVPTGYLILRKIGEEKTPSRSLEQVKPQIKGQLETAKMSAWTLKQRSNIPVTIDEKALANLK